MTKKTIYVHSPYFKKHYSILTKQRYRDIEVLSGMSDKTVNKLADRTKKCNLSKKKCNTHISHIDGFKSSKVKGITRKIKKKLSKNDEWKKKIVKNCDKNCLDYTRIPSLVRRTLHNIQNIGDKGILSKLLGDRKYIPKTISISFKNKNQLEIDLKSIWLKYNFGQDNPVILKPSLGQEQKGICVTTKVLESVNHIINSIKKYPSYLDWEIQKYIHKPLSIKGRLLFPGLKENTKLELKNSNNLTRNFKQNRFYKCHIRAYSILVYMKKTNKYKIYLYKKYKFNSAREPYPEDLLKDKLDNVDLTNPWPHKSGGTEGGASPFDFQDLIEYIDTNNLKNLIVPIINKKDLTTIIEPQVNLITKEIISEAIKKGNCCIPNNNSINTALAVYHPFGIDLLIDHNKKVWFIEINPSVGFGLISKDIVNIYNTSNVSNAIDDKSNFNPRLYNLIRKAGGKNKSINNNLGYGNLSERFFYIYQIIMRLDEKYQKIDTLREILRDHKKTLILQKEITKLTKFNGNFLTTSDINYILDTKISKKYKKNIVKDYLEYTKNCRLFWRHTLLERIMQVTIDSILPTKFRHRYQSNKKTSIFYNTNFELLTEFKN